MEKPQQPNQSIMSAVECLYTITSLGHPVSAREIAEILNKEYTHTHRILKTLSHVGILTKTTNNKYLPGYGLYMLSSQALNSSKLLDKGIEVLTPHICSDLSMAIGILFRDTVWYVIHTGSSGNPIKMQDISVYKAKQSSLATCLSAFMHEEVLIDYFKSEEMKKLQKKIRSKGYFFEKKKNEHSITFPVAPIASSSNKKKSKTNPKEVFTNFFQKIKPIAGVAFLDKSKKKGEKQMYEEYLPIAFELCSKLY